MFAGAMLSALFSMWWWVVARRYSLPPLGSVAVMYASSNRTMLRLRGHVTSIIMRRCMAVPCPSFSFQRRAYASEKENMALDRKEWRAMELLDKRTMNHNSQLYRFEVNGERVTDDVTPLIGLGQHVLLRAEIDNKFVARAYTPVTPMNERHSIELAVKIYEAGKMSQFLQSMSPGDRIQMRGPNGRFRPGTHLRAGTKSVVLVAGGSGLTPMLQLVRGILEPPATIDLGVDVAPIEHVLLIYANANEEDIWYREELVGLAQKYRSRFHLRLLLEKGEVNEDAMECINGVVSTDTISHWLPAPSDAVQVAMCGPLGMLSATKQENFVP